MRLEILKAPQVDRLAGAEFPTITRTLESFARVARWPYAGLPPKSTNSLIKSSMSARDPSGLPNGPTGSSRRRLLLILAPRRNRNAP
jgi:hypothetical protein